VRPSEALQSKRQEVRELVGRFRTANPRVFGSVLHGVDSETSDLDILVDTLPGTTLFDLGGLQEELPDLLGVRVDVRTQFELSKSFRDKVVAEAQPV
jgi:predicted nucleotidyltransferase